MAGSISGEGKKGERAFFVAGGGERGGRGKGLGTQGEGKKSELDTNKKKKGLKGGKLRNLPTPAVWKERASSRSTTVAEEEKSQNEEKKRGGGNLGSPTVYPPY